MRNIFRITLGLFIFGATSVFGQVQDNNVEIFYEDFESCVIRDDGDVVADVPVSCWQQTGYSTADPERTSWGIWNDGCNINGRSLMTFLVSQSAAGCQNGNSTSVTIGTGTNACPCEYAQNGHLADVIAYAGPFDLTNWEDLEFAFTWIGDAEGFDVDYMTAVYSYDGSTFTEIDTTKMFSASSATFVNFPFDFADNQAVVYVGFRFQSDNFNLGQYGGIAVDDVKIIGDCSLNSPSVTFQIGSSNVCQGDAVVLESSASGGFGYQWFKDGAAITGETNQTLIVSETGAYHVEFPGYECNKVSNEVNITVKPSPSKPLITASGPTVVCAGGSGSSLTLTSSQGTTYQWFLDGTALAGKVFQNIQPQSNGDYVVRITNADGCPAFSDPVSVNVEQAPAKPFIFATNGETQICPGQSVELNSTESGNLQWFKDGVAISGANAQNYFATDPGNYTVRIANGNCSAESDPYSLTVGTGPAKPTINPSQDTVETCQGTPIALVSSGADGYQWYRNGNQISGATGQGYSASIAGTYTVVVFETGNSCGTVSDPIEVIVNPVTIPVATANGPTTFCNGSSVLISSSPATSYQWFRNGSTLVNDTNQTYRATSSGSYRVRITNEFGCEANSNSITVTVNPSPSKPTIVPGGTVNICQGQTRTLTSSTASSYQWFSNGIPINNATSQTYVVSTTGSYTVQVSNGAGCSASSDPTIVNVNQKPDVPQITPDGPTSFCPGDQVKLTSDQASAYQWFKNGNAISGENGQSYVATTTGGYQVAVSSGAGCTRFSDTLYVTVNVDEKPIVSPSGSVTFCSNETLTLSSSYTTGNQWVKDGVDMPGETNKDLVLSNPGDYYVRVSIQGCEDSSDVVTVSELQAPAKPDINPFQDTTICDGQTIMFSTSATLPKQWFKNGVALPGETGQNLLVASGGYYKVQVIDPNNGCDEFSDSVLLNVTFENPAIVQEGNQTICSNEMATFTSNYPSSDSYQWFFNGDTILGETNAFIAVSQAGNYHYTIDIGNCSDVSNTVSLTVNQAPTNAQIIASGDTTFCPGGSVTLQSIQALGYQWHRDNAMIAGETSQNYQAFDEGSYYVVISNAAGCNDTSNTIEVSHSEQPEILGVNTQDNLCEGVAQGSAEILVTDGRAPYSYSLDGQTYFASKTFNNLIAGDYIAYVLDVNNCMDTMAFTIDDAVTNLNVTAALKTPITCADDNNAVIRATGSGGNGQYMYNINGGPFQSNRDFTGLAEGTYVVTIQDGNGCVDTAAPVSVVNPDTLVISTNIDQQISCHDANDAIITANVSGGVPPYKYSIDGGQTYKNNPSFNNLAAGVYRLRVKDDNGCIRIAPRRDTIVNPTEVELITAVKINDALCFGQANGQINVFAKGGFNDSLEYSADGINWQWQDSVLFVTAGTYPVYVRDPHGCIDSAANPIIIGEPEPISATILVANHVSCNGGSDASIVVNASGGTPPLRYSIDNGNTFQSEPTINGISSGLLEVLVEDTNGCQFTRSTFIFQPQPFSVAANLTQDISCFGENDAVIVAIPNGGAPGQKEYSIDNGQTWKTNNVFTDLGPNTYTVIVRDKNLCTATATPIQVVSPPQIFVNVASANVSCFGANDAFLTITASGGLGNLSYSIDGGTNFSPQSDFQNIAPGNYAVVVADGSGCEKDGGFFNISEPSELVLSPIIDQNESCPGEMNGQISAFISGGIPPYTFQLNGANDQIDNGVYGNLGAGDYVVTVTDANGCVDTADTLVISSPDAVQIDSVVIGNISCNGNIDGSIMILASGGEGDSLSYSIDGANFSGDSVFTGLSAGTYTIVVRDESNGCLAEVQLIDVEEPGLLSVAPVVDNHVRCSGSMDGQISASVSGGTRPFLYRINTSQTFQVDSFFTGLPAGNYSIEVQDAEGCTASSISTTVLNPQALSITANIADPMTCNGANDAVILANGQGGTGGLEYSIDNGTTWQTSTTFDSLASNIYVVSVRDANGCIQNAPPIQIQNPPVLNFSAAITKPVSCFGASDGRIVITASGGVGQKFYSKDGGSTVQASNTFNNLPFGQYLMSVIDANGCQYDTLITLTQPNALQIQATVVNESNAGNDGQISLNVSGGTPPYSYNWTNGDTTSTITGLEGGNYSVVVVDSNGCQKVFSQIITSSVSVDEEQELAIKVYPNPTSVEFTVESPLNTGAFDLVIFNELGEVVWNGSGMGGQDLKVSVESWAKGVYMIRFIGEKLTKVESIVIQ